MMALAHWAQHLVTFQGDAASFVADQAFVFKAHLVLGMTIFLLPSILAADGTRHPVFALVGLGAWGLWSLRKETAHSEDEPDAQPAPAQGFFKTYFQFLGLTIVNPMTKGQKLKRKSNDNNQQTSLCRNVRSHHG